MTASTNFDSFSPDYKRLLDDSVACSGETSEYFAEYKALYLARVMGGAFAGKILDYGCGIGLLSGFLKKHLQRAAIHGFDISEQSVRRVPEELRKSGVFASDLVQMDKDYQLVVIANVLHHVPPADRQHLVSEISRRLDRRGKVIVFEHNPWNPVTRWVVKHCPFDADAKLLTSGEVCTYMTRAHLSIVRRDYIVFFPRLLSFLRAMEPAFSGIPAGAQYALMGTRDE